MRICQLRHLHTDTLIKVNKRRFTLPISRIYSDAEPVSLMADPIPPFPNHSYILNVCSLEFDFDEFYQRVALELNLFFRYF